MTDAASVVERAWARQVQWSALASQLQRAVARLRAANLALLVAGAAAGALAAQEGWVPEPVRTALGALAAVALAVAALVQQRWLAPDRVARWPMARGASEAIKAQVFQWLATGAGRSEAELEEQVRAIEHRVEALALDVEALPRRPSGTPPAIRDIEGYLEQRAKEQARWHRDRIDHHLAAARLLHRMEVAATVVATVLAGLASAITAPELSAWVAAATTVAAVLGAHLLASRHDRIARSYLATANQLDLLIRDHERDPDLDSARFVQRVEAVLATQNDTWASLFTTQ